MLFARPTKNTAEGLDLSRNPGSYTLCTLVKLLHRVEKVDCQRIPSGTI